ncbi:MAG: hypothetical protein M3008_08580 [Chloroflexota bacterium]|nr:hypothetical protein [Chloroflexota bacterium]
MASSHLVRIPDDVSTRLQSLVQESGVSLGAVVQRLLKEEEERRYWAQFVADFAALRADPAAWAEELHERSVLDGTLMDGLEEYPYDDERLTQQVKPA